MPSSHVPGGGGREKHKAPRTAGKTTSVSVLQFSVVRTTGFKSYSTPGLPHHPQGPRLGSPWGPPPPYHHQCQISGFLEDEPTWFRAVSNPGAERFDCYPHFQRQTWLLSPRCGSLGVVRKPVVLGEGPVMGHLPWAQRSRCQADCPKWQGTQGSALSLEPLEGRCGGEGSLFSSSQEPRGYLHPGARAAGKRPKIDPGGSRVHATANTGPAPDVSCRLLLASC